MVTTTNPLNETPGQIQTNYFISTGKGTKMFTLWVTRSKHSTETERGFYYTKYLRNLSMDFDEAVAKAVDITGLTADEIIVEQDTVEQMQYGEDVLRFGRYDNQPVSKLEDVKYLNWLAKGGKVKKVWRDKEYWDSILTGDKEKFIYFAQDRLIELGEWVEHNGRKMSKDRLEKVKKVEEFKLTLKFGLHFADGEKVKGSNLIVIDEVSYDTQYGTTWIVTLMDEEQRIFKYKGGTIWWKCEAKHIGCGFTIKHGEYNGIKETYIQRVKVASLDCIEKIEVPVFDTPDEEIKYLDEKWHKTQELMAKRACFGWVNDELISVNPYYRLHKKNS